MVKDNPGAYLAECQATFTVLASRTADVPLAVEFRLAAVPV
jgi:hypothetical protein